MRKKKHHEEHENGEAWLLPYSDLMTLLLAVFIVLFAVSQVDEAKAQAMSDAFRGMTTISPSLIEGGEGITPDVSNEMFNQFPQLLPQQQTTTNEGTKDNPKVMEGNEVDILNQIESELDEIFREQGIEADVSMRIDERGLVISLQSGILFISGSADLSAETQSTVMAVGETVNKLDHYIRVEGHTDNVPISSSRFPTNWELSTARAASVVRLFAGSCGVPNEKMVTVGYGEYRPVAENTTPEGRAQNRRVDIIVLNTKYNSLEEQRQDVPVIRADLSEVGTVDLSELGTTGGGQ